MSTEGRGVRGGTSVACEEFVPTLRVFHTTHPPHEVHQSVKPIHQNRPIPATHPTESAGHRGEAGREGSPLSLGHGILLQVCPRADGHTVPTTIVHPGEFGQPRLQLGELGGCRGEVGVGHVYI